MFHKPPMPLNNGEFSGVQPKALPRCRFGAMQLFMAEPIKRLRAAGGAANWLATALTIAGTNWGVLVSFVVGIGTWFWKDAFNFAREPHIQIGVSVFLWTLWTYIALSFLYRLHKGIKTIPLVDYAFGIIIENFVLAIDDDDDGRIQVGINVRNVTNAAIRLQVSEIRVVLDGQTHPENDMPAIIIPRLGTKGVMSMPFKKAKIGDNVEGHFDITILYGSHDGEPVRKYRNKSKLLFKKLPNPNLGNEYVSEEDIPI